jgi:Zn-dependent peptidase ImmA (M78 family)
MIPDQRKTELNKLAVFIAQEYSHQNKTQLEAIADSEDIYCYFDHYEDCFDGMLVYDEGDFHIHANIDRGNEINTKRGRFTFAHELAHYFIDEHRVGLKSGQLSSHGSIHDLAHKDIIELEADYFASSLLMPDTLFRKYSGGKKFSLDTILRLSDEFQSSILSSVIKFAEIGTHEICAVFSQNNQVKWFAKSKDFPKWAFRFKVGQLLPPTTVAGEFYTKLDSKFTSVQDLDPNDWFYANWGADRTLHEL